MHLLGEAYLPLGDWEHCFAYIMYVHGLFNPCHCLTGSTCDRLCKYTEVPKHPHCVHFHDVVP
jgi:hypothetical protein